MVFKELTLLVALLVLLCPAAAQPLSPTPFPIQSDVTVEGSLAPNQTVCYQFSLDADATREVVYWQQAKLYLRLEPCAGIPHMKASVWGCPSQGHVTNWEYQSDRSRNDLRAAGQKIPDLWEWMGDVETLSIDVTHRNFYIEISQYHWPIRTNHSLDDLIRRLRDVDLNSEADVVEDIKFLGVMGQSEIAKLMNFQNLLIPVANYRLTAYLHDESVFPQSSVLPLTNKQGWDRNIEHVQEANLTLGAPQNPYSGNYLIAFWPPTRSASGSGSSDNTTSATTREFEEEEEEEEEPHHVRSLKAMMDEGKHVTFGDVENMLGEEHAETLEHARQLFTPDDVIFRANPTSPHARSHLNSLHRPVETEDGSPEAERRRLKVSKELEEVNKALERMKHIEGFEEAVARGTQKYHDEIAARESKRRAAVTPINRLTSISDAPNSTIGNYTMADRAKHPLLDDDLVYMIYWADITADVKSRWGVMLDSLSNEYTRLLDEPCATRPERCGVKQVITEQEFLRLDKNADGQLSRAEYEAEYTVEKQYISTGFKNGLTFDQVLNGTSELSRTSWDAQYDGATAILDASIKDPVLRTYWTACGLERFATPLVPSGNVSKDSVRAEWQTFKSFDQLQDGRLTRSIKGLDDSDNNVYVVGIIVRNSVTGERAAYKPHIVQRPTPIYQAPEATGSTQMAIIIAVASSIGAIVVIFIIAIVVTKNKKSKPSIRIKKGAGAK
mmetsp:Transcript_1937/g.3094  ORF Transcript_1937/g.3094 Transcript_1937/m.3094 type:complete len:726 (+) Transcript_1937:22-2199(+)